MSIEDELHFTSEPPTKAGFYVVRFTGEKFSWPTRIVEKHDGQLCMFGGSGLPVTEMTQYEWCRLVPEKSPKP